MTLINKEEFKLEFRNQMDFLYKQTIEEANSEQLLNTLVTVLKCKIDNIWKESRLDKEKEVYYFCIEFLLGRQLESNLLNLGILEDIKLILKEMDINLEDLINAEVDPALGNGGLGRLAACFLDSMASLNISGHGYGIRYEYGLFEQKIVNGHQVEVPDNWLKEESYIWETVRPNKASIVKFGGKVDLVEKNGKIKAIHKNYIPVMALPYDIPIIGYKNEYINTLRLFKSDVPRKDFEPILKESKNSYGSYHDALQYRYYADEISQVLYPNDSNDAGKILRLKQEYFLVSAGIQDIFRKYKKDNGDIRKIYEKISIHINDTHPSLCVPELMRLLMDEEELGWDEAWDITQRVISYTNHTIMAEAMEKWNIQMIKELLPRIYMIIEEINKRYICKLNNKYGNDHEKISKMAVIYADNVNMANLSIIGSHSVNGVAKLHTEILKKEVLKDFYEDEPFKFNNKTNGIAHRRWLILSNPRLSKLINELIGESWQRNTIELKNLEKYQNDDSVLQELELIKQENKKNLSKIINQKNEISINENSIFDVQIKRLHAYKRQLMNALHILHMYHELLDNPNLNIEPRTFIFGAKAAPGYYFAKCVIKLINELAQKINNDTRVKDKLKVVFLENYGVSLAEKIIPATNVSEQISTTTKEASGTGNMKFMMNGAITIATLDGANIEIHDQIGDKNMVLFGLKANQVLEYSKFGGYSSADLYSNNFYIKRVVDDLVNGFIPNIVEEGREIYNSLITYNDEFFVLRDFENYVEAQKKINDLYIDKNHWNKMSLINIANSGIFSSDRTIKEYANEIWYKR
ncbi:glycogen/starch/alpha-glucan phosphorylase [Paraclostridium sordellii]|uniref:glycogen/starch/alpha-glucan phosphorylase n=1 Tax=Paraclostridium sordellii TaxID=1505 RepID=UPI0005E2D21A|nr:glycogen/starch/alpha-glucan phosphorylase [Paeniclostridium sordellii]MBX9182510.1 glycogen/starch/alpha-glucan phosphorylase [Paeniclostridium sordellii]CEO16111.1 glycogen phosphorylase [[Clostridium] sordellii] [Paeniclostridium sordellii]CEO31317.1 glycogen phosphorylase [[Clostridium] sordellii] [Paeniclostridium sordellii]CEP49779.1 glycogen phosphorylase [[Clostridium] sordellii] [Paeniclostridium sordellii]CEP85700.1 glycogen phosphorylase [[Clostridium] sordellii] [Paeniclostridiu